MSKRGPTAADVLPMKQALAMITYLRGAGKLQDAAMIAVGAGFGLRIGDVLSLKWGDVLNESGNIREQVNIIEEKTGKPRTLKVFPFVRRALDELRSGPVDYDAYIFAGANGAPIARQTAWRRLKRTADAMGIKLHISPHSLRKAFCDFVYNHTHDPVMTARITGHSNPAQLLRYIGRLPEAEEAVWTRMMGDLRG